MYCFIHTGKFIVESCFRMYAGSCNEGINLQNGEWKGSGRYPWGTTSAVFFYIKTSELWEQNSSKIIQMNDSWISINSLIYASFSHLQTNIILNTSNSLCVVGAFLMPQTTLYKREQETTEIAECY